MEVNVIHNKVSKGDVVIMVWILVVNLDNICLGNCNGNGKRFVQLLPHHFGGTFFEHIKPTTTSAE